MRAFGLSDQRLSFLTANLLCSRHIAMQDRTAGDQAGPLAVFGMAKDRYPPEYNKLRRLPWWQRRAAKARLDRGEGIYGSVFLPAVTSQKPKAEAPKDDDGEWKETFVPEPVRKLNEAFELLNLKQEGATLKRAKKAYHKAAFKTHPDHGGSEEKFKAVKEAYDLVIEALS